jgi:hypothetical protein
MARVLYGRAPCCVWRRRILMKKKRKIIVYVAISADGYIARPDGDEAGHTALAQRAIMDTNIL